MFDDSGIIDQLSWPVHRVFRPGPGLGDGLGWTGVNTKQRRSKPMKTKSGLNFLGYKFSMELMRTGIVSLVKGRLMITLNF